MTNATRISKTLATILLMGAIGCGGRAHRADAAEVAAPAQPAAPAAPAAPALKPWPKPTRWEEGDKAPIPAFEAQDAKQMPPEGAIVGIGSSSMRGWHKSIEEDLAPLTVIPRGFGGSCMNDALYYTDRMVIKYRPRAVLLYEGDNDIAGGWTKEQILEAFRAFTARIHAELPETRIYFISIKPSISRWEKWPAMQEANALIEAECAKDKRLFYIDVATPMLDAEGKPRPEIYLSDNLHMKPAGYAIWTDAVRPVLMEHELKFESAPASQ